jgi:transmembrane sensor
MNADRPADNPLPASASLPAPDAAEVLAGQDPVAVAAAHWLVRRQDGLGPDEQAELDAWLSADAAHCEALDALELVWGRMEQIPAHKVARLKAALEQPSVASRGPAPGLARQDQGPVDSDTARIRHRWLPSCGRLVTQLAQVVLVFAILGGGWMGWDAWQGQPVFQQRLATARGVQQQFALPDGSTVLLDTSTQADVLLYRNRREVRLDQGQAYFNVRPDGVRPFRVHAGEAEVTVVGTRFTVRRTPSGLLDDGVGIAVDEGRVRVAHRPVSAGGSRGKAADVLLSAGESATVDTSGRVFVADRSFGMDGAWRKGRVSFSGVPLSHALAEFERYGDTRVRIGDPEVAGMRVHGSFELRRLDAFLKALPQVLPVRLRRDGTTVEILRAG